MQRKRLTIVIFAAALMGLSMGHSAVQAGTHRYTLTDLGTLGGAYSSAYAINDRGQVVGRATTSTGLPHAFLYDPSAGMTDLGSLGVASVAHGLNDHGQVVGYSNIGNANSPTHAFFYDPGSGMTDLGTLGGTYSHAQDINNSGQVVGYSATPNNGPTRAFLYDNGTMTDLGTLGGTYSYAYGINDSGQIVGRAGTDGDPSHAAFRYDPSSGMTHLGTLGGSWSHANDINATGQIVGNSYFREGVYNQHAFRYDPGSGMVDLGTPGLASSYALGINATGQIVGYHRESPQINDLPSALLYQDGQMLDLNDLIDPASGWTLEYAYDINTAGQIVGYGTNADGDTRAFLLTPVPEPATSAVLLAGLIAVAGRRRRSVAGL